MEFADRLNKIAAQAKAQREGAYTPQSDAFTALYLMETMALLLAEQHNARHPEARLVRVPGQHAEEK